jgi:uncharacterized protein with von Willebrand factor type A (vWA) domain
MSDDRNKRGGQDRKRINMAEGYELNYWTRQLGCTEQELISAIGVVGPQVDQVRTYLTDQRQRPGGKLACA